MIVAMSQNSPKWTEYLFLALVLSLVLRVAPCSAAAPSDFQLRALLAPQASDAAAFEPQGLYMSPLPRQIVEETGPNFADLRLFAKDNAEIPYVILDNATRLQKKISYALKVLSYDKDQNDMVLVLEKPVNAAPLAALEIKTSSRDFRKNLAVEASPDAKTWSPLATESIYDLSSHIDLRKTQFAFPQTPHRYLRLKIADADPQSDAVKTLQMQYQGLEVFMRDAAAKPLRLDSILGWTSLEADTAVVWDEAAFVNPSPRVEGKDTVLDLATALPAEALRFEVRDPLFFRDVEIFGIESLTPSAATDRPTDKTPQRIGRGSLYSLALAGQGQLGGEYNDEIKLGGGKYKLLRVVIHNRDNPPLAIPKITLRWRQKLLFFVATGPAASYALCFKAADPRELKAPNYDLQRFATADNWHTLGAQPARLAAVEANPAASSVLFRTADLERWLLTGGVSLICLALAGWLFVLLRKTKPGVPEATDAKGAGKPSGPFSFDDAPPLPSNDDAGNRPAP